MSRRITIPILACLAALWLAAALAQDKINPNQVITPNKVTPIPNSVIKAPPLPADPTGGGARAKQDIERAREAARLKELAEQQSGLDAAMGAGPGDDRPGFDKGDDTLMERLCKSRAARAMFLGMCGSDDGALPSDGEPSDSFDTKRPVPSATEPGGAFAIDGPTAGGRVPSRGGQASDDDDTNDGSRRKPDRSWTDAMGQQHNQWDETGLADGAVAGSEEVLSPDGKWQYTSVLVAEADRRPSARPGDIIVHEFTRFRDGTRVDSWRHCRRGHCTESQPGEPGYGQMKARAWFCARTPEAAGCKPRAPGSQIDPANPDGEGTPTGSRPTRETPRLGREAVSDPGPADGEIRGTSGGGSEPLDMKDPIKPDRPR